MIQELSVYSISKRDTQEATSNRSLPAMCRRKTCVENVKSFGLTGSPGRGGDSRNNLLRMILYLSIDMYKISTVLL